MIAGIWRSDDLRGSPRWTSTLSSPHHACILANLPSCYHILLEGTFSEITFAFNWEPLIKSFLKKIGTKRTLPPQVVPFLFPLPLNDPPDIAITTKENAEECSSSLLDVWMRESEWLFIGWEEETAGLSMCHVSDPCASSPQPLDETIISWMVEIEWSYASLHASTMSVMW